MFFIPNNTSEILAGLREPVWKMTEDVGMDKCREQFEKWFDAQCYHPNFTIFATEGGPECYEDFNVESKWLAFQAGWDAAVREVK